MTYPTPEATWPPGSPPPQPPSPHPVPPPRSINFLDEPKVDGYGTVTIGNYGGWFVQVVPMIYNDRLVLTPEDGPWGYDYGWCYPKGGAAHLAALTWDPDVEGEPAGYIKATHMGTARRAGEHASVTFRV